MAGVHLLHRFLSRIGFNRAIAQHARINQRNNRDSVRREMLLALLYPIILKPALGKRTRGIAAVWGNISDAG